MKKNLFCILLFLQCALLSFNANAQYGMEDYTSKDKFILFKKWYEANGTRSISQENEKLYRDYLQRPAPEGSSAMHKKYVHQIVFSKEPIIYGKEDESKFTTDFKFGDNIYAMAYFISAIKNVMSPTDRDSSQIFLLERAKDRGPSYNSMKSLNMDEIIQPSKNSSYLSFYIMKPSTDGEHFRYSSSLCNYFKDHCYGGLQFFTSVLNDAAYGIFNYDLTGTTEKVFTDLNRAFLDLGKDEIAKKMAEELNKVPMPAAWTAKSYPITGGMTEAAIRANYLSYNKGAQIVKLVADATPGLWSVEKNDYGVPVSQFYSQEITVFCTDGKDCWFSSFHLVKDYLGGGNYGKAYPKIYVVNRDNLLPCAKMKK